MRRRAALYGGHSRAEGESDSCRTSIGRSASGRQNSQGAAARRLPSVSADHGKSRGSGGTRGAHTVALSLPTQHGLFVAGLNAGQKQFDKARTALIQCITVPTQHNAMSMVFIEAFKKLQLVSILLKGEGVKSKKSVPPPFQCCPFNPILSTAARRLCVLLPAPRRSRRPPPPPPPLYACMAERVKGLLPIKRSGEPRRQRLIGRSCGCGAMASRHCPPARNREERTAT